MERAMFTDTVSTVPATQVPPPQLQGVDALLAFFDEDDAEHEEVLPHYSLAAHVSDEVRFSGNSALAEIFELHSDGVGGYRALRSNHSGWLSGNQGPRVEHLADGLVRIKDLLPCAGTVKRGNQVLDLQTLTTQDGTLLLKMGDSATLQTRHGAFLVRLIPAPASIAEVLRGAFARSWNNPGHRRLVASSLGLSVMSHLMVLLGAWVLELRNPMLRAYPLEDEFARDTLFVPPPELTPPAPPPVEVVPTPSVTRTPVKHRNATPRGAVQPAGGQPMENQLAKLDRLFKGRAERANQTVQTATQTAFKSKDGGYRTNTWSKAPPTKDLAYGLGHGDGARPRTLSDYARKDVGQLGSTHGRGRGVTGIVRPEDVGRLIQGKDNQPALPLQAISKVVMEHVAEIQRCYETALFSTPGLHGKVKLEWIIGPTGTVTRSRSVSSDLNTQATNCMVDRVKAWKFPPLPNGNTVVTFPFVFRPVNF